MFNYCERLQSVDITNFDPSNVTTVAGMFYECDSLTSIDLSSFRTTDKLTDMRNMFYGAYGLSSIDLSAMDTSSVTDMNGLFRGTSITSVDFTKFSTASVTDIGYMLAGVGYRNNFPCWSEYIQRNQYEPSVRGLIQAESHRPDRSGYLQG